MIRDSIMQPEFPWEGKNDPEAKCYVTGRVGSCHFHHIFEGVSGYKRISEEQGLWCYLDWDVHMRAHQHMRPYEDLLHQLRVLAQSKWETRYMHENSCGRSRAKEAWMRMIGKNYI
jgi:hypothetical protein